MEWGEYTYEDFFKLLPIKTKLDKSAFDSNGRTPVFSAESSNNGIMGYTNIKAEYIVSPTMPIYIVFGDHTRSFNIATESFCVADNVKVLIPKSNLSLSVLMFITSAWRKCIPNKGYMRHWSLAQKVKFHLPIRDKKVDFNFMENFIAELETQRIAELEAYLSVTGLKDTRLSLEEEQALLDFEKIQWGEFAYKDIFDNIKQGRRLKKNDQIKGNIPFVMSGVTNNGVVSYISNPVLTFPENSITLDIFGNAFYRCYGFGAGDDTGVYWNEKNLYSKSTMLFMTTAMEKSVRGKFSYGKKLRSSQSLDIKMMLPLKEGEIDFDKTNMIISAIQKLVIKDVVAYADSKISVTKQIAGSHN